MVEGIAKTGKPVTGFAIEKNGDLNTICAASRKAMEYVQWAGELQREKCDIADLWVSTKCGESDTTSGLASNPTVGDAYEKLDAAGCTLLFGETTELTGGEQIVAEPAPRPKSGKSFSSSSTVTPKSSTITRSMISAIRSPPKATSKAD